MVFNRKMFCKALVMLSCTNKRVLLTFMTKSPMDSMFMQVNRLNVVLVVILMIKLAMSGVS